MAYVRARVQPVTAHALSFALSACGPPSRGKKPAAPKVPKSLFEPGGIPVADPQGVDVEPLATDDLVTRATRAALTMRAYLIDVGQGAATLLEFPCGAVLIDAGGEGNKDYDSVEPLHASLEEFFEQRPVLDRTVELVVIAHPHTYHTRGGDMLLETSLGTSHQRDAVDVMVGDGKQNFVERTISAPIYSTAWDGSVWLTLTADGAIEAKASGR